MRIISPFHDYYDSAVGYGQDPSLIYKRIPRLVTIPHNRIPSGFMPVVGNALRPPPLKEWQDHYISACIGFCGKAYPVLLSKPEIIDETRVAANQTFETGLSGVLDIAQRVRQGPAPWWWEVNSVKKLYHNYCERLCGLKSGVELHTELDAPVFLALIRPSYRPEPITLITNPRLANFRFAKVIEPFAAFQEIAMFLGSQLTNEDQAPRNVGGDKIIAQSKGFNEQSFRTAAPGQKKLNRAENRSRKKGASDGG